MQHRICPLEIYDQTIVPRIAIFPTPAHIARVFFVLLLFVQCIAIIVRL